MNDREFITSLRDQCNAQLGVAPPVDPGPVDPPPPGGGGGGGTQPPYNGAIHWELGMPDTVSPTDTRRDIATGVQYAIRFTKTSDANKLRIQGTSWFSYVNSEIPGVRGNYTGMQMAGYHDIPLTGAPNGPLVVLFSVTSGIAGGAVSPQAIGS